MIVDNSEQTLWCFLRNNFESVFSVKYEENIRAEMIDLETYCKISNELTKK